MWITSWLVCALLAYVVQAQPISLPVVQGDFTDSDYYGDCLGWLEVYNLNDYNSLIFQFTSPSYGDITTSCSVSGTGSPSYFEQVISVPPCHQLLMSFAVDPVTTEQPLQYIWFVLGDGSVLAQENDNYSNIDEYTLYTVNWTSDDTGNTTLAFAGTGWQTIVHFTAVQLFDLGAAPSCPSYPSYPTIDPFFINGDFEQGVFAGGTPPYGYVSNQPYYGWVTSLVAGSMSGVDTTSPRTGLYDYAFVTADLSSGLDTITQYPFVQLASVYALSWFAYANSSLAEFVLQVQVDGTVLYSVNSSDTGGIDMTSGYQRFSALYISTYSAGSLNDVYSTISISGASIFGSLHVDDISLELYGPPPPCVTFSLLQCLDAQNAGVQCHMNIATRQCDVLAPAPLSCAAANTSIECYQRDCYWDRYVTSCFDALSQVSYILPCSFWAGQPGACVVHNCTYDNGSCDTYAAYPVPTISTFSDVHYGQAIPTSLSDLSTTSTIVGNVSFPIVVDLSSPLWYVLAIGDYSGDLDALTTNINDACSSLSFVPSTPITYNGSTNLTEYLIGYLSSNSAWPMSDTGPEAVALNAYLPLIAGNDGSLVHAIRWDATHGKVVLEYALSPPACVADGVFVVTLAAQGSATGSWYISSADVLSLYDAADSGLVVSSIVGTKYGATLSELAVSSSNATCYEVGEQALVINWTLSFQQQLSNPTTTYIQPRTLADVSPAVGGDDQPTAILGAACDEQGNCWLTISTTSMCLTPDWSGNAFDAMTHGLAIASYECNNGDCFDTPLVLSYVAAVVDVLAYPTTYAYVPDFTLVALLAPPPADRDTNITLESSNSTFPFNTTLALSSSNMSSFDVNPSFYDEFSVGLSIEDATLMSVIALSIDSYSFTPLDSAGEQQANGTVITDDGLAPYLINATATQWMCSTTFGCDGFTLTMTALQNLSAAPAYLLQLSYSATLPLTSVAQTDTRRRLLSYEAFVDGNTAYGYTALFLNASWFSSYSGATVPVAATGGTSVLTLTLGIIVLIVLVVLIVFVALLVYARCKGTTAAPSAPRPASVRRREVGIIEM